MVKKFIAQYKREIVLLSIASFLFFLSRIYHLQFIPIFVDEAIYAWWAQLGKYDPSLRLFSLVDGKQPLYIWLVTLMMNYIYNPIIAGRLVSILAGFGTMIGLFLLSLELFKSRAAGIIATFLYVFYPFALLLNRMALYESLLGMFFVWTLYIAIRLVRHNAYGTAFTLGLVLGGALLTKSSSIISMYLLPTTLVLFPFKEQKTKHFLQWISLIVLSCLLAFLYYSVLLLSDKYYMIAEKNALFTYHIRELIPYGVFQKWGWNVVQLFHWTATYLTYPLAIFAFFSLFRKSFQKEKLLLMLWFLIPFLGIGLFGRSLNTRYIFPLTLLLLPLIAITMKELYTSSKNVMMKILIVACMIIPVFNSYTIITDMSHAPIPTEDLQQYVNGTSSGAGFREIIPFLQQQAVKGKILVATEGLYGSLPTTVIELYFAHNTQVEKISFEKTSKKLPKELYLKAKEKSVYVIFNETQSVSKWPNLKLINKYKRGTSNYYLSLHKFESK